MEKYMSSIIVYYVPFQLMSYPNEIDAVNLIID